MAHHSQPTQAILSGTKQEKEVNQDPDDEAGRVILELRKKEHRELYSQLPEILEIAASGTDPELLYLKKLYHKEFKEAFRVAVSQLQPKQRNIINYHLVHRLSIDKIASIYGTHRATAARWINKIRLEIAEGTRDILATKLDLSNKELQSVYKLIRSQLDLSLDTVLAA